jgi:hypothetical protein
MFGTYIPDVNRGVGVRQVQNVLTDLREGGYLRTVTDPISGRAGSYSRGRSAYVWSLDEDDGTDTDSESDSVYNPTNEVRATLATTALTPRTLRSNIQRRAPRMLWIHTRGIHSGEYLWLST